MKNRDPFLLALSSLAPCILPMHAEGDPPNFILFITDDISQEDLSCYGGPVPVPNHERLAASGMLFSNAYVTASSCSPSRSSIITSRYPHNHGAPELHMPLPSGARKFPGQLRRSGYYSVLNGKNHMTYDGRRQNDALLKDAFDQVMKGGEPSGSEEWIDVMRSRPTDQPFFFWFSSHDAHRNWQINEKAPLFSPEEVVIPPYLFDGPETRRDLADYYHEVARTDYYLGLLLDEVERQGIADRTYIILTSDNGRPFPRSKATLYDSGTKVPFLISGPGIPAGTRSSSLISLMDIGPAVLELAGVPVPDRFQGVSVLPVLKDPEAVVRDYVFAEQNWHVHPAHERMVRYKNWMYIRNNRHTEQSLRPESSDRFPAGKELRAAEKQGILKPEQRDIFLKPRPFEQLYQVDRDPHQLQNLSASPEYDPVLKELRAVMDAWIEETGDSVPVHPTSVTGGISPEKRGEMPGGPEALSVLNKGPVRKEK